MPFFGRSPVDPYNGGIGGYHPSGMIPVSGSGPPTTGTKWAPSNVAAASGDTYSLPTGSVRQEVSGCTVCSVFADYWWLILVVLVVIFLVFFAGK